MPDQKDQYTPAEFKQLIKAAENQKPKKKATDLTPYMCTYGGPYTDERLVPRGFFWPAGVEEIAPTKYGLPTFAISLPGIGPSLNKIWSKSLSVRELYKLKKSWRTCTHLWLQNYNDQVLLGRYVSLFIGQFEHGRKMYDSLNLAPTAKMIEDALTKKNPFDGDSVALLDDNPAIIGSTTCIPWQATEAGLGTWSHLFLFQIG
jgi:hypothetical protein